LLLNIGDLANAKRYSVIKSRAAADEVILLGQRRDILEIDAVVEDLEEVVEKNGGHASFPVDLLLVADGRVESPDGVAFQAAH